MEIVLEDGSGLCSAATNACFLTDGINLDHGEKFLVINFQRFTHPEIILEEFNLTTCKETEKHSLKPERMRTSHTSEDRQGTIPMPTFAPCPLTTSSTIPVELPQNYMVGQQRQQMSELQSDKSLNPQSFLEWKIRWPGRWCPQPACVQTHLSTAGFARRGRKGELTSCRGTV